MTMMVSFRVAPHSGYEGQFDNPSRSATMTVRPEDIISYASADDFGLVYVMRGESCVTYRLEPKAYNSLMDKLASLGHRVL